MGPTPPEVVVLADAEALVTATGTRLATALAEAQAARGTAAVVLTGGTVGIDLLRGLLRAAPATGGPVDWSRVDVWWGDERFVPAGDPDRNDAQAARALLDAVPLDPTRVHPMPRSDGPDGDDVTAGAQRYAGELAAAARREGVAGAAPVLDVLLLGIGPDGHVASLFPGHRALHVSGASVVAVTDSPKPPPTRISLTLETITGAEQVWCVVSGTGKAGAVAQSLSEDGRLHGDLPASRVTGTARTLWLLDADAASELPAS